MFNVEKFLETLKFGIDKYGKPQKVYIDYGECVLQVIDNEVYNLGKGRAGSLNAETVIQLFFDALYYNISDQKAREELFDDMYAAMETIFDEYVQNAVEVAIERSAFSDIYFKNLELP